jgi:hypothetical protein
MEAHMRFTRTACLSVLTLALGLGASPALAADDGTGQRWLWEDRPACAPGERAVWVDRAGTPPRLYFDPRTGRITLDPGEPEFHGWECQPIRLHALEP